MTSKNPPDDTLEALLEAHARDALPGQEAEAPHLDDGALARIAEGRARPTVAQRAHLEACLECREVLAAAAVAVPETAPEPRRARSWTWWLAPGLAAAMAAAVLVFVPFGDRADGLRMRGALAEDGATVSFLATTPDGRREILTKGARVPLGSKLGFRYGNPNGAAGTLTVLGFDGEAVRWYYPEARGKPAFEIEGGPQVINARLPFDIQLTERHRAGPLRLVAAFDVSPEALADALRAGKLPAGALTLDVELVEE